MCRGSLIFTVDQLRNAAGWAVARAGCQLDGCLFAPEDKSAVPARNNCSHLEKMRTYFRLGALGNFPEAAGAASSSRILGKRVLRLLGPEILGLADTGDRKYQVE